jgi:hypothetical protein
MGVKKMKKIVLVLLGLLVIGLFLVQAYAPLTKLETVYKTTKGVQSNTAYCPTNRIVIGGGCQVTTFIGKNGQAGVTLSQARLVNSYPSSISSWTCMYDIDNSVSMSKVQVTASAICADVSIFQ